MYRTLVRDYPDVSKNPAAAEIFQEIRAYGFWATYKAASP
jgi:hypothetical protein